MKCIDSERQNEELRHDIASHAGRIDELRSGIDLRMKLYDELLCDHNMLKQQNAEQQTRIECLERELALQKKENASLSSQLDEEKANFERYQDAHMFTQGNMLTRARNEKEALLNEILMLKKQLADIQH